MTKSGRIISSLAIALTLAGCGAVEQRRAHYDRTWPAGAIRRIEIREVAGSIAVEGGASETIQMSADVRARGARPDKAKLNDGYFTSEVVGDTLVIGTERHRHHLFIGFWNANDTTVDYQLRVPTGVAIDLHTISGRIATRGMAGETNATTINGEMDLESTGANELAANAVNGRIEARFLNDFHGARLKTVNGRVTAILPTNASFLGDFTQVNGDFEAAFPLNIHSHPGSRRVSGEVNGGRYSLKITTVNGDIKIDNGPSMPVPPLVPETPKAPPAPRT